MRNEFIEIHPSDPALNKKVKFNIDKTTDKVFWRIKFNTPLDSGTITPTTMAVTDENNKILDTKITCNPAQKLIIVQPLETYIQEYPYILNISKKVCATNGQPLKEDIRISFKLRGSEIIDMKILKGGLDKTPKKKEKLPQQSISINLAIAFAGILLFLISMSLHLVAGYLITIAVMGAGVIHIVSQIMNHKNKSIKEYNRGVLQYNKENYEQALFHINHALSFNADNELAKQALAKIKEKM